MVIDVTNNDEVEELTSRLKKWGRII